MLELELVRDTYSRDMGVFGKLSVFDVGPTGHGVITSGLVDAGSLLRVDVPESVVPAVGREKLFECETVERPWANNAPNISCIPEGKYELRRSRFYRRDYDAYEVVGVKDRSRILIHIANTPLDVEGCIGLGERRSWIKEQWAVANSTETFAAFMHVMGNAPTAVLTISQYDPFLKPS